MNETRYPRPGDRTQVNIPGTPHHDRRGTITSLGPFASSVALDGEHGDEHIFRNTELGFPDEAPDDPTVGTLSALREYAAKFTTFRKGDGADPGEPPVVAMLAACGEIERLRDEVGEPIYGED